MDTEALKRSLLKKFQEVTADRLQKIQLAVIELEKPEALTAASEEVARELHTMKGEARMLGLVAIGRLAHAAEDVLTAAIAKRTPMATATDLLLRACDAVSDLVEDFQVAQKGNEATDTLCASLLAAAGTPAKAPSAGSGESARTQTVPPPPAAASRQAPVVQAKGTKQGEEAEEPRAPRITVADRSIRVNVEVLDLLGMVAGNLLVENASNRLRAEELKELLERFSRASGALLDFAETLGPQGAERTRLEVLEGDVHLLRDDAFRFVRSLSDGNNSLQGNLEKLAGSVTQARLVPLASVFDAFPRAVRDLARQQGKDVALAVENADVGVDRSMLADVRDALVHLVRNAIDHGLETKGERAVLGKPETGRLKIRVRMDGEMLHLDVEDDGRGIDPAKLRQVAAARGVLPENEAQALSDREAIDLIFRAGFSTRAEVTDTSGRGVGMDVVKRKVEDLGGSVSVQTRLGRGSTFSLRMPQSLALMRVLLIRLGEDVYGIPAADVEAVIRIRQQDRLEVFGTLAVNHRGKPTTMVSLGSLLGLNGGPRYSNPPAVVVSYGDDRVALVVDGFVDEREVPVKPCGGEFLQGAPFVGGAASLEDGRIAVLLHLPDVMTEVRERLRPVSQAPAARRLRVLLVDDSPIARATESALVRALGHTVEEAQDGEEGWARAEATSGAYDLILTDVQMPKLDGFALTRRLKANAKLAKVPVIILSSLASPEDRRRGADAGADAYLIKGELGVESLAQTIDRLTS
ncbi:MAG: hybrid sensor histidine kinase/response regulator [Myxococcaceae bacterium]